MLTPYAVWLVGSGGSSETPILTFTDEIGLSDEDAKTAAIALLQTLIDKITTPSPDTIEVRTELITPTEFHTRLFRRNENLQS